MIEKITNVSITKPDDFEDREWSEVLSRRNRLLSITDWTQSTDSNLLPSNQIDWIVWRDSLRRISRCTYTDKELAKHAITALENARPPTIYRPEDSAMVTSIETFKIDMLQRIEALNTLTITTFLGMSYVSFDMLVKDAIDFTVEKGIITQYMVLSSFFDMSELSTVEEFVDSVFLKYKELKRLIIDIEQTATELRRDINAAQTMDQLKNILDCVHGYRH